MKTLSHWQWLVLAKNSSSRLGHPNLPTPYRKGFDALGPSHTLLIKTWLSLTTKGGLGSTLRPPQPRIENSIQQGLDRHLDLSKNSKLLKFPRYTKPIDHAFLVSGLLRFGEELGGSFFSLLMLKNILENAHPTWVLEVLLLHSRLSQVFKLSRSRSKATISAPSHPWYGGSKIIVGAVCSRDPFLLAQWAKKRMSRMRLFAHKRFLRLLGSFLRGYVNLKPAPTRILGFNLVTTGKISVTGNAMSRTMLTRFGKAGINNLSYRASSSFALIKTKTGCLGLNLVFYF